MNVEESIDINASSESVFSYLMNIENRKEYIPALYETILLDPLPFKIGSRYTEIAEIAGKKLNTTYQIIELIENKKVTAKTLESIFPIQVELSLSSDSQNVSLTIELDFTLKGIFKLSSPIVKGIVRSQAISILVKIKENLESNN